MEHRTSLTRLALLTITIAALLAPITAAAQEHDTLPAATYTIVYPELNYTVKERTPLPLQLAEKFPQQLFREKTAPSYVWTNESLVAIVWLDGDNYVPGHDITVNVLVYGPQGPVEGANVTVTITSYWCNISLAGNATTDQYGLAVVKFYAGIIYEQALAASCNPASGLPLDIWINVESPLGQPVVTYYYGYGFWIAYAKITGIDIEHIAWRVGPNTYTIPVGGVGAYGDPLIYTNITVEGTLFGVYIENNTVYHDSELIPVNIVISDGLGNATVWFNETRYLAGYFFVRPYDIYGFVGSIDGTARPLIRYGGYYNGTGVLKIPIAVTFANATVFEGKLYVRVEFYNGTHWFGKWYEINVTNGIGFIEINAANVKYVEIGWPPLAVGVTGDRYYAFILERGWYWMYTPPPPLPEQPPVEGPTGLQLVLYWSGAQLVAEVTYNGNPVVDVPIHFYLPWDIVNKTIIVNTDGNGMAVINVSTILQLIGDNRTIVYEMLKEDTWIVAAVSYNGEAAIDNVWAHLRYLVNKLEPIFDAFSASIDVVRGPGYAEGNVTLCLVSQRLPAMPVGLTKDISPLSTIGATIVMDYAMLRPGECYNISFAIADYADLYLVVASYGWWLGWWIATTWPVEVKILQAGNAEVWGCWGWGLLGYTGENIVVRGSVRELDGAGLGSAAVYASMLYEYIDGFVTFENTTDAYGNYAIVFPAVYNATDVKLAVYAVHNGTAASCWGELPEVHGYIDWAQPPPAPSPTPTPTPPPPPTQPSPSPTLPPVPVGGTLRVVEATDSGDYATIVIGVAVAALAALALLYGRRRS